MEYTKIKMTSQDDAKRFYRIIAIQGNPDLYELGAILGESVNAWFEHFYYFNTKDASFIPDDWVGDRFGDQNDIAMSTAHLSDLTDKFTYTYDSGENWCFDCKVYKKPYNYVDEEEYDDYPIALVLEGKGQGIFENDHGTLDRYLDGEIDPNSSQEDEENFQFLPMNMDFEKYGDFDEPLDLEEMIYYKEQIEFIAEHFRGEDEQNDDEDIEDEIIDKIMSHIADSIFNDEPTNKAFRRLIQTQDINDAYEAIVVGTFKVLQKEYKNEKEFDKAYKKMLKEL